MFVPAPFSRAPFSRGCTLIFLLLCSGSVVDALPSAYGEKPDGALPDYQTAVRPLLERYCYDCHAGAVTEADLDLAAFESVADVRAEVPRWVTIRSILTSRQMPPPDAAQPSEAEFALLDRWVHDVLAQEAGKRKGDPGPTVLRRLNNAEYRYAIRDLTGIDSLDPTDEFPIDGAAGEGFTNVGSGQGMSPALLQKYYDAAKAVAAHAVLVPDGLQFSPHTTRRDWTDAWIDKVQSFYERYTATGDALTVERQGITLPKAEGGRLPLRRYLRATLEERSTLRQDQAASERIAAARGLNGRYLRSLWTKLAGPPEDPSSFLLAAIRERWEAASPDDTEALAVTIEQLQSALWKFNSIGHIGREGGPERWMEGARPIVRQQDFRVPLPRDPKTPSIALTLGSSVWLGSEANQQIHWLEPRLEFPAGPDSPAHPAIPLREIDRLATTVRARIARETDRTDAYLAALAEHHRRGIALPTLAAERQLSAPLLTNWANVTGLADSHQEAIDGHLSTRQEQVQGYSAVNGWSEGANPSLLANRSEEAISFLTLTVPGRGVTVHPSPQRAAVVSWRSPFDGTLQIESHLRDADAQCGNGIAWRLEQASQLGRAVLSEGNLTNGGEQHWKSDPSLTVRRGDVISLVVAASAHDHVCDTTHVELRLQEIGGAARLWDLAEDVVDRVLEGNPLNDRYGHQATWHFRARDDVPPQKNAIVADSSLAAWRDALFAGQDAAALQRQAAVVRDLLTGKGDASEQAIPDADTGLRRHLLAWRGPLGWLVHASEEPKTPEPKTRERDEGEPRALPESVETPHRIVDPTWFVREAGATSQVATTLQRPAGGEDVLHLPAALAAGAEFVTSAVLVAGEGDAGAVQPRLEVGQPPASSPTALDGKLSAARPLLVGDDEAARRVQAAFAAFRQWFPPILCYARIVPVDEVVTMTLLYREDEPLQRLMLDAHQRAELDRLWEQLRFISREPLQKAVAYEQLVEFATQDRPDLVKAFKPLKTKIAAEAEAFRAQMRAAESNHLDQVIVWAAEAWRRPLQPAESARLRSLYKKFRREELPHEEAIRLTLARVLTSPEFLYKLEARPPGPAPHPISDHELATRLSLFLWSSIPDDELRRAAAAGTLHDEKVLLDQTHRMLRDGRTRRLAVEFACQWLHVRDFDQNDDKNEAIYPEFPELRASMYEETVRFFTDLFQRNGSVLEILNADHTFLNRALAEHYRIEGVDDDRWQRIEGIQQKGRGGILAMATILASQSGASRTSPILRGNWVYETLLGERLPRPPAGVPTLPDTLPEGLTERELIEQHSSVEACARCHVRIDPYGFALEQYDAIGRRRPQPVDTSTTLPDGRKIEGLAGLRDYLLTEQRDAFLQQFCRKLLGYALGREVELGDEPLLEEMQQRLAAADYRVHAALETIITSVPFRQIRGGSTPPPTGASAEAD